MLQKLSHALVTLLAIGAPVLGAASEAPTATPTGSADGSSAAAASSTSADAAPAPSEQPQPTPPSSSVEQPGTEAPARAGKADGTGKLICRYVRTAGSNIAQEECWRVGASPESDTATSAFPRWVYGTLAGTTACGGLALFFGLRAKSARSQAVDYVADSSAHSFSEVQKLESDYNSGKRWAYITGAGAGAFAIASVVGLIRGFGTAAVTPVVGAGTAGVLLTLPLDGSIGGAR